MCSVTARILDSSVDFTNRVVDDADGSFAVPAFVGQRQLELMTSGAQVTASRNHMRLCGVRTAREEPREQCDDQKEPQKC